MPDHSGSPTDHLRITAGSLVQSRLYGTAKGGKGKGGPLLSRMGKGGGGPGGGGERERGTSGVWPRLTNVRRNSPRSESDRGEFPPNVCLVGPGPKNQEPSSKSKDPRSKTPKPRPKTQEPRAKTQVPGPRSKGPGPKSQGPGAKIQGPRSKAQGPGPKTPYPRSRTRSQAARAKI